MPIILLFYVWVICLHVYVCITCVPGACRHQKWASGPLGTELCMVVTPHVGVKNGAWVLPKTNKYSNGWAVSPCRWFLLLHCFSSLYDIVINRILNLWQTINHKLNPEQKLNWIFSSGIVGFLHNSARKEEHSR